MGTMALVAFSVTIGLDGCIIDRQPQIRDCGLSFCTGI